jgi:hypothetical protein
MRQRSRILLSALMSLPMIAVLLVTGAAPADAKSPDAETPTDLTCAISATAEFSPGITLLSRQQQLTGSVQGGTALSPATPCTSLSGVPYQGFTMELNGAGDRACGTAALTGGVSGTARVTWDNGDTSMLEWSVTTAAMVPVPEVTVTDGALAGATVVVAGAPTSLTGNCLLNDVTKAGFAGVAEFAGVGA